MLLPQTATEARARAAQCPNFNSLTVVSLSAAIMSLAYSTIGFGSSIDAGLHYTDRSKIDYTLNREPRFSGIFGVFNALGTARPRRPHGVHFDPDAAPPLFSPSAHASRCTSLVELCGSRRISAKELPTSKHASHAFHDARNHLC